MTLSQAQTELNAVNAAIASVLSGGKTSYGISGRSATMLPLGELRQQRRELELIIARLQSGTFSVVQFRAPE